MITTLSLQNFKCFQVLENISFGKVNLFTGSNGRGKSTILQSLLLLAQSIDNERLNHIELNGRFIELGTFDDVRCRYTGAENPTIKFTTDDKDENELTIELAQYNNKQRWASIAKLCVLGKNLVEETGSDSGNDSANSRVLGVTSTIAGLVQLHNVYFISADRKGPTDYIKKNDNGDDRQMGVHGEFLINSLARKGSNFIQKVENETSKILSGATIKVKDTQTDYLQFYLDSANTTDGFRPSNVGFGYSYVLPIITTLLFAEKGAKVFIENPEAHLHPGAQSRLIEFLVKYAVEKDIQLFIETHSDHIINGLRIAVSEKLLDRKDAHIIHFNREDSKSSPIVSQIKIDGNGNLSDYPQGFMDEWGIQMSKLV
jgi:hypothetical protein BACCOPRO_00147